MAHDPELPLAKTKLDGLLKPVHAFLASNSAGGIVLIVATLIALIWANSPAGDTYSHLWHTYLSIGVGSFTHRMSLEHWVNDGLMVIFFLLVGLEIKRELLLGELASVRRAALPVAAAIGGMVVPATIFAVLNYGRPGAAGWGIPMATDIAFAVGVLALVGRGIPVSVKVFLLAIAIVDDLGAVLVIAFFYTQSVSTTALLVAALFLAALVTLNALKIHNPIPYLLIGIGLWAATLASGVHATIAGVLLAFTIPATRQLEERPYVEFVKRQLHDFDEEAGKTPNKITSDQSHAITAMQQASQAVQTPLARIEHALLRPVNFLIVPLFALANAGVDFRSGIGSAISNPTMWGVLLGLLLGKPIGILLASWIAIKSGVASMPAGANARHLIGVSIVCGIGFTMSLFVANLAFPNSPALLAAAKVGILAASLLAGVLGAIALATSKPVTRPQA